jgi:segregation and condensation protein B|tara:strand:+ start:2147 stop:2803 length:657 start_codon:yes stop_codon:yes gene_type:complete
VQETPKLTDLKDQEHLRVLEAIIFASNEPIDESILSDRLPEDANFKKLIHLLSEQYSSRGVNLVKVGNKWTFRTAPDLADSLEIIRNSEKRLSRAAQETLAIIAYNQPVTRADIESIRGVTVNRGTLDVLLEAGWIKPGRRRNTPGRPTTWQTSDHFLSYFGLESIQDLPEIQELKAAGVLDTRPAVDVYASRSQQEDIPYLSLEESAEEYEDKLEPL